MKRSRIERLESLVVFQALENADLKARIAALEHENTLLSLKGDKEEDDGNRIGLAVVDPR